MTEIRFTVPLVPPSVNHYVKHTRTGRHYVTEEARAFMDAVAIISRAETSRFYHWYGATTHRDNYEVEFTVFQGKGHRGDVDNYGKVVLDGLAKAGVIWSDSAITSLTIRKCRDRGNPRTEIVVRAL